ncbi:hypothetical protein H2200_010720 [Cladophialophora chaetospira]|uniref:Uncharacterized protein n=1 Tax=Cladophialophora chaetospira TaxID=386627 RepID=A0AA38X0L7_9EURO|nr:hypothetical protein H2200_010720 [Cladophialophora chaetospira]
MGNTPSSPATRAKQDAGGKISNPNIHTNVANTVSTKRDDSVGTVRPKVDGAIIALFNDTVNTVVKNATYGEPIAPVEETTSQPDHQRSKGAQSRNRKRLRQSVTPVKDPNTRAKILGTERVRKRKRKQPGQTRESLGFLPRRFKYLPLDLKKSMRDIYKMYALQNHNLHGQDVTTATPAESQTSTTPTSAYTFVVKEAQPVQCKYKRRPQMAIHREVLSTHPTAWEGNVAVLQLLHEKCGRDGWNLKKCCMCGSTNKDYKYCWIDDRDGCLKAGFAKLDDTSDEDLEGTIDDWQSENEEVLWQGWVVERNEAGS